MQNRFFAEAYDEIVEVKPTTLTLNNNGKYPVIHTYEILAPDHLRNNPPINSLGLYEIKNEEDIVNSKNNPQKFIEEIPSQAERISFLNAARNNHYEVDQANGYYFRLKDYSLAGLNYILDDLSQEEKKEKKEKKINITMLDKITLAEDLIKDIKSSVTTAPHSAIFSNSAQKNNTSLNTQKDQSIKDVTSLNTGPK